MPLTSAEQAIVDHLAAEPGSVTWASPASPGGWVASVRSGGGEGANPATVRFRKSRTFASCQLHEVEYATRSGRPQRMLVRTWQKPGGSWVADPIGGGGGPDPYRPRPWFNFAAQWSTDLFAAGGRVTGEGSEPARLVRLTFADGTILEDVVHNSVVLFFASPGVTFPATVQILNAADDILASYQEFNDLE